LFLGKRLDNFDELARAAGQVFPTKFEMKGNYGVAIHWSDGHFADIFPFRILKQIVDEVGKSDSK